MSEAHQSTAAVVKVKGVSFNYLQFLWSQIGQIRQQQAKGNPAGAMGLMTGLIDYLPDSIKEKFRDRARRIQEIMNQISSGSLPQIQKIPDYYTKGIYKNRLLQLFSNEAFQSFVDDLTSQLNRLGYMENLKQVAEGTVDTETDWIPLDKERKRRGQSKKRKPEPTGVMD